MAYFPQRNHYFRQRRPLPSPAPVPTFASGQSTLTYGYRRALRIFAFD